jgi:hypothetical protein
MRTGAYTVIGWAVWQIASRLTKLWIRQNRAKVGAAAVVGLVLVAGLAAAKSASGDDS